MTVRTGAERTFGHRPAAEVVEARSPLLCRFFAGVMRRRVARAFHALRIARPGLPALPEDAPVIVYTNHPSWWDPAVFMVLMDRLFPRREGYGPIEAAELERYGFMRRIGVFGVETGTPRAAGQFLETSAAVLSDPRRVLWVTAEGAFADPRRRPLRLRPGVAHLMARGEGVVALPMALEYPFWTESRPEALCRFGQPLAADGASPRVWQDRLQAALAATMDALAADAIARDAARFLTVVSGSAGTGGAWGAWQRARALLSGETWRPEHGAAETLALEDGADRAAEARPRGIGSRQGDTLRTPGQARAARRAADGRRRP